MKTSLFSKPLGFDTIRWLQSLVALLMIVGVFSVVWELVALHSHRSSFLAAFDELGPDVSSDDLLHLSYLQTACHAETNTVLPWSFAAPGNAADQTYPSAHFSTSVFHKSDPRLLEQLRQCPDVDIYMPSSARGPAGCAAVAGPLKFLRSRLLPRWALDFKMYDIATKARTSYFKLCPKTPVLFMAPEHVLEVTELPSWPSNKPVYLMVPGLELETTSSPPPDYTSSVLERTDVVLCRTRRCHRDMEQYLQSHSSKTRVLYTSQVSADPSNFARRILGDRALYERNLTNFAVTRFAHTTWNITSKTTQDVMDCWSTHVTELPPLDVYLLKGDHEKEPSDGARLYKSFPDKNNATVKTLDALKFARTFANSSFFICPTANDDCLDLARASGGVIVTADGYPMNELISGPSEGLLFPTDQSAESEKLVPDDMLLLPPAPASYRSSDLCNAVLKAGESTSVNDRMSMGTQARHHFNEDAKLFMLRMLELSALARASQDPALELQQNLRHLP
ncbi:unnamed protein product [Phytophthora lilii]|uniref:Unnamed protein product n=1 Tax=Phytophthora lilii TaxID=2077276 RepID=A0A9W6U6L8_9STRA|nr:unnamed protein product [Phytophthora lilii]